MNARIHASFTSKSGSVSKSHATAHSLAVDSDAPEGQVCEGVMIA
jgi:hypothetical protein